VGDTRLDGCVVAVFVVVDVPAALRVGRCTHLIHVAFGRTFSCVMLQSCMYKQTFRSNFHGEFVGVVHGQSQNVSIRGWFGVDV
jgi:hypothetical protein